jgi:hypothetical protein
MKATKQPYVCPEIEIVFLDNEISLALTSNPPIGPDEEDVYSFYDNQLMKSDVI